MTITHIIRLRRWVAVLRGPAGISLVETGRGSSLGPVTTGQSAMMQMLAGVGGTEQQLIDEVMLTDGPAGLTRGYALLASLREGRWLRTTLKAGGGAVVTIEPSAAHTDGMSLPARSGVERDGAFVLSRFSLARRSGQELVLESPRAGATAVLHDARATCLLSHLANPLTCEDASALGAWAPAVLAALLDWGLAVPENSDEETALSLRQWTPHELWFHIRSNFPAHGRSWGGTAWARDRFPPLPAQRPVAGTARIALPTPDLDAVIASDPPLTQVMESRRSSRVHDNMRPLGIAQLGEFLYRTVRVRRIQVHGECEVADRPHPSGGSLHELELYVVVANVSGLERGLYRYDGAEHALDLLAPYEEHVARLSERAASAARMDEPPQVVFVVSARFGRTMWKYESMAYALVLKNTGVLMASMYLVATAMRLAPCAIAGPDAALFARATGLDPATEASVGGFTLGSAEPGSSSRRESEEQL